MTSIDTSTCVLRTRGLRKEYGKNEGLVRAVDGVDLEVERGETVAIMGPSGCGKSTLLYLLGGLDRASGGEIWLDGQDLTQMSERALARLRRDAIGFVFQAVLLLPLAICHELRADLDAGNGSTQNARDYEK